MLPILFFMKVDMLKLSGTKISLTKGDSAYITINICKEDGSPYILQEGDEVSIQVRHKPNGGELLFNGVITDVSEDKFVWYIRPEDTNDAEIKVYYWDAQIKTIEGDVYTFIPMTTLRLTDEVTTD